MALPRGAGTGHRGGLADPRALPCTHLHLGVAVPSLHVAPVLHRVLRQLPGRGRPQDRGVVFLLEHTRLVADGDPVTGEGGSIAPVPTSGLMQPLSP